MSFYRQAGFLETEMEVLKSRTLAEKVVTQLGLSVNSVKPRVSARSYFSHLSVGKEALTGEYTITPSMKGTYLLDHLESPLLVEGRIGALVELPGLSFRVSPEIEDLGREVTFEILEFSRAVRSFMKQVRVEPVRDTRIVRLTISANDPIEAQYITNTLASTFVSEGLSYKRLEAKNLREFLEDQLDVVSNHLEESEMNLEDFKERNQVVVLDVEAEKKIEKLAEFEAKCTKVKAERNGILKLMNDVTNGSSANLLNNTGSSAYQEITAFPSLISNLTIQSLKQQLIQFQIQKQDLSSRFTEAHPDLTVLNSQIELVEKNLRDTAKDYINALESEIIALENTVASIQSELEELPAKEVELARLQRKAKVNEEIYTLLLTHSKEAQISEASEIGDIRIADPAIVPEKPIQPKKRLNALLGLILGLVLSLSLAFVLEYLDDTVKTWDDIKENIDLPLLGSIPSIFGSEKANKYLKGKEAQWFDLESKLLTHHEPRSPIAESYRNIRTNIQYFDLSREMKTLLFTSSSPREGKSTTVSNLAITLAQQGQKVLLVDCDLRKPVLNHLFYQRREPGLTNVLMGQAGINTAIRRTKVDNLDLLPCGSIPPNPSELLSSERMKELLIRLQDGHDFILLDSPPILAVTDASILSTEISGVILVVRSGNTSPDMVEEARDRLDKVGARVIGVVMNDLDLERHYGKYARYSYSSYYYYGGDGTKKKKSKQISQKKKIERTKIHQS
jgi:tyrosine-protein kinase Etk/Wzc